MESDSIITEEEYLIKTMKVNRTLLESIVKESVKKYLNEKWRDDENDYDDSPDYPQTYYDTAVYNPEIDEIMTEYEWDPRKFDTGLTWYFFTVEACDWDYEPADPECGIPNGYDYITGVELTKFLGAAYIDEEYDELDSDAQPTPEIWAAAEKAANGDLEQWGEKD